MAAQHDIFVVSDLHIGRGTNQTTRRYYRLEAFFYDDDFQHFCNYLIDDARLRTSKFKLILNGDTFDFLRVDHDPSQEHNLREKRYGPALTPNVAVEVARQILEGHPVFVAALASVLEAGHSVVFLPGNHDIEMQWDEVQNEVRHAILGRVREQADQDAVDVARKHLIFQQWFYYEEGRVWIEHGCQYDAENAFQFFLRRNLAAHGDNVHKAEVDVPLGTFFQKYLYNQFGNITFLVPNSRSNVRYFRWLLINRPRLLARVSTSHFPFFWQILRRIAKGATGKTTILRQCHEKELNDLVKTSPLGEKLRQVEALKRVDLSSAILAKQAISRVMKIIAYVLLGAVCTTGLWTLGVHSIGSATFGVGFKALLFLGLNFLFFILTIVTMMYFLLRPASLGYDPWMSASANTIAKIVDVPIVTFGHTHDEKVSPLPLGKNAWYYNTGTWIAVFTPDSLLPRERVQYTFLRIRQDTAELLHWSPGRAEAMPVVLIDQEAHAQEVTQAQ